MSELRLLGLNALYALLGAGLLPLLGLRGRHGLAYLVGIAAAGLLASALAVVGAGLPVAALGAVAGAAALAGLLRRRPGSPAMRGRRLDLLALPALAGIALLLVHALGAFRPRPLLDWDAWAVWGTKAKALYYFGGADPAVFASAAYDHTHLDYPIAFPALEALVFRALGEVDGQTLHLQFLLLALAAVAALAALLRDQVRPAVLWPSLLALVAAPAVLGQLLTAFADVPLGLLAAAGLVALGRWVADREPGTLPLAALLLAAAASTKNEGVLVAVAALVAAALATRRLLPLGLAALGAAVLAVPWRIYAAVHDLPSRDFEVSAVLDPGFLAEQADRLRPAVRVLAQEALDPRSWGLVPLLFALGIGLALTGRRRALAGYAGAWAALTFSGLAATYWISRLDVFEHLATSASRVVVSLGVGMAALAPLLASARERT